MDYLIERLLCSFVSGIIISQTGCFIQLATRNILASPSTLGFDGLSVLWLLILHSVFVFFSAQFSHTYLFLLGVPFFVLVGLIFSSLVNGYDRMERIILLGLTFNLFVGAVFSLWQFFFMAFNLPFPVELWFGHFRYANIESLALLVVAEIFILTGLGFMWKELMLFSLGNTLSKNWELKSKRLFSFLFVSISLGTFIVVTLFGAFSFLGLIFPIISRKIWFKGMDLKGEILLGGVVNGLILMLIDFVCYYFPVWGAEVPVGLIVTAVGALTLIILLWKTNRESIGKFK